MGAASRLGGGGKKKKKKARGVLGKFDEVMQSGAKGLTGAVGSALGGLQQGLFKTVRAGADVAQGDLSAAGKSALGAFGEIGTLGQAGGDIDFATAIGHRDSSGKVTPAKLPRGLNTAIGIVADPLNLLTFGAGSVAKSASAKAVDAVGKEAAERLATQGFKKGLSAAEKRAFEDHLLVEAGLSGSKNAAKTAAKQIEELSLRGRGGVTVRVPGASKIPGVRGGFTAMSGETAEKIGAKSVNVAGKEIGLTAVRDAAKASKFGKTVRAGLIPGARVANVAGSRASEELLDALDAGRAAETNRVNDLATRLESAKRDFGQTVAESQGKTFNRRFARSKEFKAALDEADTYVSRALQSGDIDAAKAARPELARLIDTGDAMRKATLEANVEAGTLADDIGDQSTYMHRIQTEEAAKALRGEEDAGRLYEGRGLSKSMNPGSTKARVIARDSSEAEINEAIRRIHAGEDVPDDLLKDYGRIEEYQAPIRQRIDELEAQKDAILQRNLEARPGELTVAQQRRMAAEAEVLRRLDKQISREAARLDQVTAAAERAKAGVQAAGESRLGRIIGEGREQLERAGQLDTGLASRRKQANLKAKRLEKSAAVAKQAPTKALRQFNAEEARTAANELKGVQRARTPKEVARDINRRAGTAQAVTRGQTNTAEQLTAAEARRQETALQRAVRERDAAAQAAADRAERYKNQAAARAVKQDERELAKIQERVERLTDQLAEKAKLAEDDTRTLVEDIAQKLPPGTPLYRESAVASLMESGVEAARAVETAQMMNNIRGIADDAERSILLSGEDVAAGAAVPEGWVEFKVPKLGKFYAHPAVKGEITKFSTIMEDDIVSSARKALNTWDRWWRGQVTAALPGGIPFATRNARTNVMLTVVDGMNPKYFVDGGNFQRKVAQVIKKNAAEIADDGVEAVMARRLGARDFKLWKAAREYGVVGDGFYNIDIADAPQIKAAGMPKSGGRLRRGVRFVAGSHGTLATKGRELNQIVEDHARMSHFLYSVDRLGDLEQAAARTNTVLFDYGRVTPFEQKFIKKIMPFWTFMRKNLPGQIRAFVENPIRVALPEKLSLAMSDPLPEDAPEYQRRAGTHLAKFGPFAGMLLTPERPLQAAASSLEPLAQLGGALVPGNQGAIEPEGGVPQALRSLVSQVGGGPASFAKAVIEEGTGKSSFTGFNLKPEERRQRFLQAIAPQLGRAPTIVSGRLPLSVIQQATRNKAEQKTLAQIAQALGFKIEEND